MLYSVPKHLPLWGLIAYGPLYMRKHRFLPLIMRSRLLRKLLRQGGYHYFIETGTYRGDTTAMLCPYAKQVHTIELGKELAEEAKKRFQDYTHVHVHQGDSGEVLPKIMPQIKSAALFYLDGHYSGGITAKGEKECPIYEELKAIFASEKLPHLLVIDDARCFVGESDYPTVDELVDFIKKHRPAARIKVKWDAIRAQL